MNLSEQIIYLVVIFLLLPNGKSQKPQLINANNQFYPTFQQYTKKINKQYSPSEIFIHKKIHDKTLQSIKASDQQSQGYNFSADWSEQQLKQLSKSRPEVIVQKQQENKILHKNQPVHKIRRHLTDASITLPTTFDWRGNIKMTSVRNQGSCGAYWAYSTVSYFQTEYLANNSSESIVNLSEKYLIQCDKLSKECESGYLYSAMDMIVQKGGIPGEQTFQGLLDSNTNDPCQTKDLITISSKQISRLSYFSVTNQEKIKQMILKKPLNIAICSKDLYSYYPTSNKEGKRTLKCNSSNTKVDHSVLMVGYTETEWIVRNSWGPFWGIDGFAYISRTAGENCCIGSQIHLTVEKALNCPLANCQSCVSDSYCAKCNARYYLTYNTQTMVQTCLPCKDSNCQSCLDYQGTCLRCISGYTYIEQKALCAQATISNCVYMNNTLCLECEKNFVVSSDQLQCWQNCGLKNCISCKDGKCIGCINGFTVVNYANGTQFCEKISCSIQNCRLCNSNGQCIQCHQYYQNIDGKKCQKTCTLDGCVYCNTNEEDVCYSCEKQKSLNYWTNECEDYTFSGCQQFGYRQQIGLKCDSCKIGFYFNEDYSLCIQTCAVKNCTLCQALDTTECTRCADGFTWSRLSNGSTICTKNECLPSMTDCSICDTNGICLKCIKKGYYFNSTTQRCQVPCRVKNCQECYQDAAGLCLTCNSGYTKYSNLLCYIPNNQNCVDYKTDSETGLQSCSLCQKDYRLVNQKCKPACKDQFCENCLLVHLDNCIKCLNGYKRVQDPNKLGYYICKKIDISIPNCLYQSENGDVCYTCIKGYFFGIIDTKPTCYKVECLTRNCVECDKSGVCTKCDLFYTLNQKSECQKSCPIAGCLNCSANGLQCYECEQNKAFETSSKICNQIDFPNCLKYQQEIITKTKICMQCRKGSEFNPQHTKCIQQCQTPNCNSCSRLDTSICLQCQPGYYLESSISSTTQCLKYPCNIDGCQTCNEKGQCLSCINQNEEVDSTTGECSLKCYVNNCVECIDNSETCYNCSLGFYLYDGQCYMPNDQHCMSWNVDAKGNSMGCAKCQPSYELFYVVKGMEPKCKMNCVDNFCETCSDDIDVCTKCLDGFKLTKGMDNKSKCEKIVSLIRDCQIASQNQTYCYYCRRYYFFNQTSGQCQPFTANCNQNCMRCSAKPLYDPTCRCINSMVYFMDTNKCVTNPLSSSYCNSIQSGLSTVLCVDCITGFKPSASRLFCERNCIVPNCETCTIGNSAQCLNCDLGYYKKALGQCAPCEVQNCAYCRQGTNCQQCMDGFQPLIKNNVISCIVKQCPNNMLFDGSKCYCANGLYEKASQCYNCTDLFPSCARCNLTNCLQCKDSLYLSSNKCLPCSQKCKQCSDYLECLECEIGYVYSKSKYRCIETAISDSSYFINGQKVIPCVSKCQQCSSNGVCLSCKDGFRLDDFGTCVPCLNSCKTCSMTSLSKFSCLTCDSDNTMVNNACFSCRNNCAQCTDGTGVCTRCNTGYFLDPITNTCTQCQEGCFNCTSFSSCVSCSQGYTIQANGICSKCLVDCITCLSTSLNVSVLSCGEGYFPSSSVCLSCPDNCLSCNSSSYCTKCLKGYTLANNLCYPPCDQGCYSCDPSNFKNCLVCFEGYSLDSSSLKCLPDLKCNANSNCTLCPLRYVLKQSKCEKCTSQSKQCIRCSHLDTSVCLSCQQSFYLSPTKPSPTCIACSSDCQSCSSSTLCSTCLSGFYLNNNRSSITKEQYCLPCKEGCKNCLDWNGKCVVCKDGYEYLDLKGTCIRKERVEISVKLDVEFNEIGGKLTGIRKGLLKFIGDSYVDQDQYLIVRSMRQGSTIIDFELVPPLSTASSVLAQSIKLQISQLNSISNIPLISVDKIQQKKFPTTNTTTDSTTNSTTDTTNSTNNSTTNDQSNDSEQSSSSHNILVAVTSTVAAVLMIVVVGFVIYFCKKKKEKHQENDKLVSDSGKTLSDENNSKRCTKQKQLSSNGLCQTADPNLPTDHLVPQKSSRLTYNLVSELKIQSRLQSDKFTVQDVISDHDEFISDYQPSKKLGSQNNDAIDEIVESGTHIARYDKERLEL